MGWMSPQAKVKHNHVASLSEMSSSCNIRSTRFDLFSHKSLKVGTAGPFPRPPPTPLALPVLSLKMLMSGVPLKSTFTYLTLQSRKLLSAPSDCVSACGSFPAGMITSLCIYTNSASTIKKGLAFQASKCVRRGILISHGTRLKKERASTIASLGSWN